jgi:hypothetical protein
MHDQFDGALGCQIEVARHGAGRADGEQMRTLFGGQVAKDLLTNR